MRVSYNWLQDYVELQDSPEVLAEKLTFAGLEIDQIERLGEEITGLIVAKVLSCEAVAGSDHLSLCQVDGGGKTYQVVCGAPNVAAGQTVALAPPGAALPGGLQIKEAVLKGVTSQGMLCSRRELGLDEDHSGIWILPDDLPAGADLLEALRLRDAVLVLELTPNRSDCLGMLNTAHEVAALTGARVQPPRIQYAELGPDIHSLAKVTVEDAELCPRYCARLVQGVKIAPSPLWMQQYLLAAGMRPINNVVDISNFVMLELNQPLHTFDYRHLAGGELIIRRARPGETMQTLDGKQRTLALEELMICDAARPVCIAGVMGGMDSEVTEQTTDILIEAACFHPASIRRTARHHGIPSESSQRFEKGVDITACDQAARRCAQLLVEYCGGTAARGGIDVHQGLPGEKKIQLRISRVNHLLGTNYQKQDIAAVMQALAFPLEAVDADTLLVQAPSYRQDITLEEDLIEEVARLKGYEHIPVELPLNAAQGRRTAEQRLEGQLRRLTAGFGLQEAVNYSFISPRDLDRLLLPAESAWRNCLPVSNPLTEEQSIMRPSLLPGLLANAARNWNRRNLDLRLFEMGAVFRPDPEQPTRRQPEATESIALLLAGSPADHWRQKGESYDFFALKGIVEAICRTMGVAELSFRQSQRSFLHPGRCAEILLAGELCGLLGEVHPLVAEAYELVGRVIVAELALPPFYALADRLPSGAGLPKYPASHRDIALQGAADIPAATIAAAIRLAGGPLLREVRLFDHYDGAPIPAGQRSLAYALTFQDAERTLTDQEVDAAFQAIVAALAEQFGLVLR